MGEKFLLVDCHFRFATIIFLFILFLPINTFAETVILTWDPNDEPDLAGYSVYGSIESPGPPYSYIDSFPLNEIDPENPQCEITDLENNLSYYFVVTAYDTKDNESEPSNPICTKDGKACLPCVLDLTPKDTIIPRGGTLTINATITNTTGEAKTIYVWSNVTIPDESKYPPSGYLVGPYKITLNQYEKKSGQISHRMPTDWPLGNSIYHGYVGNLNGDIIEEYSFLVEVIEAVENNGIKNLETTLIWAQPD